MAIATKSYNPGFLTDEELADMFCVRTAEFESLLETLRENTGESNQHTIVGGKVADYVAIEIRKVAEDMQRELAEIRGSSRGGL